MSKPKAYSYTRMSTLEQLRGDSRRRQFARAREYAEKQGLEIVDRFDDWGVSAYRGKNAEFGALRLFKDKLDAGEIARGSYLIVESMDRLSRDKVLNALALLTEIVSKGIVLVTLDDQQVYSEKTVGEEHYRLLIALGSMTRAHEESKRKSGLVAEAWQEKKRLAREERRVTTRKVPGWLHVNEQGLVEEMPERVAVLREIFSLARDGWGAFSISRMLNERKEPVWSTRKHAVWRESYIKKMLKSRTVLGEYQPHKIVFSEARVRQRIQDGDPIIDYYPAVISRELFSAANDAIEKRRLVGKGRKGRTYTNLFSGLLRCSCGAGYRYIDKGDPPKGGSYLQCSVAFQKGSCQMRAIRYEPFETLVLRFIQSLDVQRVLGGESRGKRINELRMGKVALAERLATTKAMVERLVDVLATDEGAASRSLAAKLLDAEREEAMLSVELLKKEQEIDSLLQTDLARQKNAIDKLLGKLRANDEEDRNATRRAMVGELQRLLMRIVVKPSARVAWEMADSEPDWKVKYGVSSMAGLERLVREHSYEVLLVYHSGDTSVIDSMDGRYFSTRGDARMKSLEYLVLGAGE